MVVGKQTAADVQGFLQQWLGLRVLTLVDERVRLPVQGIGRLKGDSIFAWHGGHPPQRLETPVLVHRFEMLRPLDPRPQGEQLLAPGDRLIPAILPHGLVNLLLELLGPLLVVAGQLAQSLRLGLRFLRRRGLPGRWRGRLARRRGGAKDREQSEPRRRELVEHGLPPVGQRSSVEKRLSAVPGDHRSLPRWETFKCRPTRPELW